MPTFEIDGFLEAKTPVDKLDCILGAVSTGSLPVDIGSTLVSMVKDRQDILEIEELQKRIEELEASFEKMNED